MSRPRSRLNGFILAEFQEGMCTKPKPPAWDLGCSASLRGCPTENVAHSSTDYS
jgi:hypothetical protein